jgi:hypothetical protein
MPRNSFTTPVQVGHWDAACLNPFELSVTMGQAILERVPPAPATLMLLLPCEASDGDWYEWSDPSGLVSTDYPLNVAAVDKRPVNGQPHFASTHAHSSGKAVYDGASNQWALIGAR